MTYCLCGHAYGAHVYFLPNSCESCGCPGYEASHPIPDHIGPTTYDEADKAEIRRIAAEIHMNGVGTTDRVNLRSLGYRHHLRAGLQRYTGYKIAFGIDRDWDTGRRFGWFERQEARA